MSTPPIVVWQMRPVWGLPNPSPFCMKLETWLRIAGIPYVAKEIEGPPKSGSGSYARSQANLVAFCDRMKQAYWADWKG